MKPLLNFENLNLTYNEGKPSEFHALKSINLKIYQGEFVAILGKSGSGKTSLLQTMSLLRPSTKGKIFYKDQEITNLTESEKNSFRRQHFGYVFQKPLFFDQLSLKENVIWPLFYGSDAPPSDLTSYLAQFGIEAKTAQTLNSLSGGEKQRAGIARALIKTPEILFADEPTGALDSQNTEKILKQLQTLHQSGQTIVLITHSQHVADSANRIIRMKSGQIESDQVKEIISSPKIFENSQKKQNQKNQILFYLKTLFSMSFTNMKNQWLFFLLSGFGSFLGIASIILSGSPLKLLKNQFESRTNHIEFKRSLFWNMPTSLIPLINHRLEGVGSLKLLVHNGPYLKSFDHQHKKFWAGAFFLSAEDYLFRSPEAIKIGRTFHPSEFENCTFTALLGKQHIEYFQEKFPQHFRRPFVPISFPMLLEPKKTLLSSTFVATLNPKYKIPFEFSPPIFFPLSCSEQLSGVEKNRNVHQLILHEPSLPAVHYISKQILSWVKEISPNLDIFQFDFKQLVQSILEFLLLIEKSAFWAGLIIILLSSLSFYNLTISQLSQQKPQIALLKILGGQRFDILLIFMVQSISLTLVCCLLGIFLGWGVFKILSLVSFVFLDLDLTVPFPFKEAFWGCSLILTFAIFFACLPTWKIAKQPPAEILDS
jgi:putative ABC transport system ATP-binding protein